MKIGILTYHACYNFGAVLQAYALQQVIKRYEPDCEIINFQSKILRILFDSFTKRPTHPKEIIKNITRFPYRKTMIKRQKLFEEFIESYLQKSPRCQTEEQVKKLAAYYDCIVCGSDQIWNLDTSGRLHSSIYYLDFPKTQRRVAYAASFGNWVSKIEQKENKLLPWIKEFDMVSMREKSGVDYLKSKGITCEHVLDPSLLLQKEDYDKVATNPNPNDSYILCYSTLGSKGTSKVAKRIAKELSCRVFTITPPPRGMFSGMPYKLDVGPREYLGLIENAAIIITDAFHGVAFSIIYRKAFVCIKGKKAETRMESLLNILDLKERYLLPEQVDYKKILSIDYSLAERKLNEQREKSLSYLKRAIVAGE